MLKSVFTLALVLCAVEMSVPAHASRDVPSCFSQKRAEGEAQFIDQLKVMVSNRLAKMGINLRTIDLRIKAGDLVGERTYVDFFLYPTGSAETVDGSQLVVAFNNGQDSQSDRDQALYIPVSVQNGFDREGNPINQRCSLRHTLPSDHLRAADTVWVSNKNSGRILMSMPLPRSIRVF